MWYKELLVHEKFYQINLIDNMANEKIDTTQNIITPPEGDRGKEKRLLEALKAIPDEEIIRLWEEFDEEERIRKEEEEKRQEEASCEEDNSWQGDSIEETATFENIWSVEWDAVEYDESTSTVKWRWKTYKVDTFVGCGGLMNDLFSTDDTKWAMEIMKKLWL